MYKKEIRNLVLQNAVKFNGKANTSAVIGHIISTNPKLKENIKEIAKEVNTIVKEINKLSLEKQLQELKKNAPELLKQKKYEKKQDLKELPNAKKERVVMRLEPSPSGPLHIGHAYVGSLNYAYCKKYNGKFIVRISDTNPNNIYLPSYEMIEKDSKWLWDNVKVMTQSDNIKVYYKYAEKLFEKNALYVCNCNPEKFKELILKKETCPCRGLPKYEQLKRWKKMLASKGYKKGEAVVRFKSSLDDKNPAMRDFPLLRINKTKHPKTGNKYRVWPLMNFAVAIDDLTSGVTHNIRGKDHADNEKRQRMIFNALGEKAPTALFVGRINFKGFDVSCTKTKEKIEKKIYNGWDDIRIPFIPALKRRGYQPESFVKYAIDVGVSLTDKTVHINDFFKLINHFNKEVIDKTSNRYFFIENPKKIKIQHPEKEVKIPLHPDFKEKGHRILKAKGEFYIQDKLEKNKNYRLMYLFNFKNNKFVSEKVDEKLKAKMIHWLPVTDDLVDVEILMDDGKTIKGLAEPDLKNEKINNIVQFERFGFCRLDKIENKKYKFWFTHK